VRKTAPAARITQYIDVSAIARMGRVRRPEGAHHVSEARIERRSTTPPKSMASETGAATAMTTLAAV